MPILNYTTKIKPEKTIMEIQTILAKHNAKSIRVDYSENLPTAIIFAIDINDIIVNFKLPANYQGVYKVFLNQQVPRAYQNEEQALRTSWRIVKDWLQAQMALIESGQADFTEVLFPYMLNNAGDTIYSKFLENSNKMLEE